VNYGTGSAPTNGTAGPVGTLTNFVGLVNGVASGGIQYPWSCTVSITGLTLNTQVWLDIMLKASTGGSANCTTNYVTIWETF
jgi:hypothetical protein